MKSANILVSTLILLSSIVSTTAAYSADSGVENPEANIRVRWQRIDIPEARCGDGSKYSVFIDVKDKTPDKLLIEFMGGGACWSSSTCESLSYMAWLRKIPMIPAFSYLTYENSSQPWAKHSVVYFPYCTGDVHSADVIVDHDNNGNVTYHTGYKNIVKALEFLQKNNWVNFSKYKDVTVWGASAGAIGAMVHAHSIETYLKPDAKKTLIADSPGLHFGRTFWHKFPTKVQDSFKTHFGDAGLVVDLDDGLVAKKMGPVFDHLKKWNIGILQASRDYLMSSFFGEISPVEHEKLVFSREGIIETSYRYGNVRTWTPRTYMHTFLLVKPTSQIQDDYLQSGLAFAKDIYLNGTAP
jgi:hypothetical protein